MASIPTELKDKIASAYISAGITHIQQSGFIADEASVFDGYWQSMQFRSYLESKKGFSSIHDFIIDELLSKIKVFE